MNAIDSITKFVLAHSFVEKRTKEECYKFLKQIKDNCYEQILERFEQGNKIEFTCDKFANYKSAFSKLFYRTCRLNFGVPIACKKYGLEYNNNPIERYNGKMKDRLNAMRGEFKSFEKATCFMNLQHIVNNFVNPHQELKGKTPMEKAEIKLNLGRNKLLGLIKHIAQNLT